MPGTILITKVAEDLQTWRTGCRASTLRRIRELSGLLVELSTCVPGRYVSFNSLGAGHSLSQWHVSVNRPPHGLEKLPIEQNVELQSSRSRKGLLSLGQSDGYPVPVFIAIGPGEYITNGSCNVIADWDTLPAATGNLMVTKSQSGEMFTGLFWPRITLWRRAPGFRSGEIAALELSGYFPLSDEIDLAGVADGRYDYRHFWKALHATADQRAFDRCAAWVC